jgi:ubiquinone/menaquinone biosynthesis C-methylase UbiE
MTDSIRYDTIASRYDETRGGLVRGAGFARDLAGAIGDVDGTILDLGVGTGAVAQPLRDLGYDVTGVDLSLPMLHYAHERLGPAVVQGDALRLPVRSEAVAAVTMSWLLQLVPDAGAVFAECRRVLRPGGRVAAVVAQPIECEPCDIMAIERTMAARLGLPPVEERAGEARAAAERAGLRFVAERRTEPQAFEESPAQIVERNRQRLFGSLVELSDDDFDRLVEPALEDLLALPEPERPRRRVHSHPLVVLGR